MEKTGELYARWFQFAAFTPSFRSHARTWHLALPWGWGLSDMGLREGNGSVLQSEMNNPAIEPVTRAYDELRYQLIPYNYTLAREAHEKICPYSHATRGNVNAASDGLVAALALLPLFVLGFAAVICEVRV